MAEPQGSLTVLLTDGVGQIGRAIIDSIIRVPQLATPSEISTEGSKGTGSVLPRKIKVLAGHHSADDAHLVPGDDHKSAKSQTSSNFSTIIEPVLVDWKNDRSWVDACRKMFECGTGTDSKDTLSTFAVVLLLPFTVKKKDLVDRWVVAISQARKLAKPATSTTSGQESDDVRGRKVHILLAGIHTRHQHAYSKANAGISDKVSISVDDPDFLLHEEASFEAEQTLRRLTTLEYPFFQSTFVRINFDGFNTLCQRQTSSHPGPCIAYFLPKDIPYGWIARSDIADFMTQLVLDGPTEHTGKIYPLSTTLVSIIEMADIVSAILTQDGSIKKVSAVQMLGQDLESVALHPTAIAQSIPGYEDYIKSLAKMFTLLVKEGTGGAVRADHGERGTSEQEKGSERQTGIRVFNWHYEVFPDCFQSVVGKRPLDFRNWVLTNQPEVVKRLGIDAKP